MKIVLTLLLIGSFLLRMSLFKWDAGYHMHPDERQLMIVADQIHFFDQLNPHFFSYGSLPLYILKAVGQIYDGFFGTQIAHYDGLLYVGRLISALVDTATVFFVFLIGKEIFKRGRVGILAGLMYGIAFFPIQNGHFFVVDVFLTFFFTVIMFLLLTYIARPSLSVLTGIGLLVGGAVATKFTAVLLLPFIATIILFLHRKDFIKGGLYVVILGCAALTTAFIGMPYAFLDFKSFIADISNQTLMSKNAYIFPYTLQYVGTIPYLYYLKNIFLWGVGPFIGISAIVGLVEFCSHLFRRHKSLIQNTGLLKQVVWISFALFYFTILGGSAVKFMRYLLPLYPFIAILAGYGIFFIHQKISYGKVITIFLVLLSFGWTYMFLNIYDSKNTRIQATDWILENIPPGSRILTEHWDDRLPLMGQESYSIEDLTLYDLPDDELKWDRLNNLLSQTSYIVIASNRLYVPLQKLSDCSKFEKCYPMTADYYKKLFNGSLGFKKVAEFSSYPRFNLGPIHLTMPDDAADESFTVYDHPKIMIFQKTP